MQSDTIQSIVRQTYSAIAQQGTTCGCSPTCCTPAANAHPQTTDVDAIAHGLGYSATETIVVPEGSNLGLGCGNPQSIAALKQGEVVLDLGSGAGFDAFLAARAVGPTGRVIGVDMTPEMITRATRNRSRGGFDTVEFRLGEIENLPVADAAVDVIISNCVINLSPDKPQVFREAFRVLKPGGRLAISDRVALAPIPEALRKDVALYTGCITGASTVREIRGMLEQAGFTRIRILRQGEVHEIADEDLVLRIATDFVLSASIEAVKPGTRE